MRVKFLWREGSASCVECGEYPTMADAIKSFDERHHIEGYTIQVDGVVDDTYEPAEENVSRKAMSASVFFWIASIITLAYLVLKTI